MKAEDLMIGDWVHYKMDLGKDGIYEKDIKITNIYGCEVNCELRGYEIISGKRMDNLEPIPLTPEILEKNGFKKLESDTLSQTWAWAEKSEKIYNRWVQITFYNEPINGVSYLTKIETCSQKGDGVDHIHSCDIESVHELQHALKLCGIDLEIKV